MTTTCVSCGYDLSGLDKPKSCPECGRAPADTLIAMQSEAAAIWICIRSCMYWIGILIVSQVIQNHYACDWIVSRKIIDFNLIGNWISAVAVVILLTTLIQVRSIYKSRVRSLNIHLYMTALCLCGLILLHIPLSSVFFFYLPRC